MRCSVVTDLTESDAEAGDSGSGPQGFARGARIALMSDRPGSGSYPKVMGLDFVVDDQPKVDDLRDHGVIDDHLVAGMYKLVRITDIKKGWATTKLARDEVFDQACQELTLDSERTVSALAQMSRPCQGGECDHGDHGVLVWHEYITHRPGKKHKRTKARNG